MMTSNTEQEIKRLVEQLDLKPHPEGGYYREIYRSDGSIPEHALNGKYDGDRNYCTSIYFLLSSASFSAFHRIKQDEIWHFYQGSPAHIHVIDKDGNYVRHQIGMNLDSGQVPQVVVSGGQWFASEVPEDDGYCLVGCTVAPGFDFLDFEMAERRLLTSKYPQHEAIISRLTRV